MKRNKQVTPGIQRRHLASVAAGVGLLSYGAAWASDMPLPSSDTPSPELFSNSINLDPSPIRFAEPTAKLAEAKSAPAVLPWPSSPVAPVDLETSALLAVGDCSLATCLSLSPTPDELETGLALPTGQVIADPAPAIAQAADGEASGQADLARASQNPIASLISVPFQNNTNFGVGEFDRTSNILNVQPVIPVPLSDSLTLVNRTIVPIAYQPELAPGLNSAFGLGDINYTGFFVPNTTGSFTWGVGPSIVLPTATDTVLGTGKWSVGPAAVGLVSRGPIVAGALVSQLWSFAGDSDRDNVSLLTVQPFFNYNFDGGWYATTSPIITANWQASDEQFTVPIGGGAGRVFKIGSQPVNASMQAYWNVIRPDGAADWTLRAQLTLLFP